MVLKITDSECPIKMMFFMIVHFSGLLKIIYTDHEAGMNEGSNTEAIVALQCGNIIIPAPGSISLSLRCTLYPFIFSR